MGIFQGILKKSNDIILMLEQRYKIMSILMAYDGKQHTEGALDYAIGHAIAYNMPLYFVSFVVQKDNAGKEDELISLKGHLERAKRRAAERNVEARTFIEVGNPAEVILSVAERIGADTIIMGRHTGMSTFDRMMAGSVSEHVMRNAKCTVIIVQQDPAEDRGWNKGRRF